MYRYRGLYQSHGEHVRTSQVMPYSVKFGTASVMLFTALPSGFDRLLYASHDGTRTDQVLDFYEQFLGRSSTSGA
jgi:hypothetical protein